MQAFNITPHYTKSLHSRAKLARCNDPALRRACGSCNEALCLAPRPGCNAIMCAGGRSTWSGLQHALMLRLWPRFAGSQGERKYKPHGQGSRRAQHHSQCARVPPAHHQRQINSNINRVRHAVQGINPPCTACTSVSLHPPSRPSPAGALRAAWTESAARFRWQYQQISLQCKQTAARELIAG